MTQDEVRLILNYNEITGILTWTSNIVSGKRKRRRHGKGSVGSVAGSLSKKGYIEINYLGKLYKAHQLIWLYVHGFNPVEIDHKNKNRTDNSLKNLRIANRLQQAANTKLRIDNTTGYKGVSAHRNKFVAYIRIRGKTKYLGLFETPDVAHKAYMAAANILFGEFACHG